MKWFLKLLIFVASIAVSLLPLLQPRTMTSRVTPESLHKPEQTPKRPGVKRWVLQFSAILALLAIGGLLVSASGIISIKASGGHWAITRWFLEFSKSRSVATHTIGIKVPPLDDPAMILKGAGHYETACSPCHGSPYRPQPRVAEHMLPRPPNLEYASSKREPEELFYIVKHGIKLTGMPAWPASQREDEVWAMVAFLEKLPELNAAEYRRLASGETTLSEGAPIEDLHTPRGLPRVVTESCMRCHGADGLGRGLGAFPKLAGQKPEYLFASMEAYARSERHSGIMEPVAAGLSLETKREIANYYADLPAKNIADSGAANAEAIERGERIALSGIPKQGVPACIECHGHDPPRNETYPLLGGQYPDYLVLQLELFKKKQRGGTPYSHLMHLVAERLTQEQIRDVALYWGSITNHHHDSHPEGHK